MKRRTEIIQSKLELKARRGRPGQGNLPQFLKLPFTECTCSSAAWLPLPSTARWKELERKLSPLQRRLFNVFAVFAVFFQGIHITWQFFLGFCWHVAATKELKSQARTKLNNIFWTSCFQKIKPITNICFCICICIGLLSNWNFEVS